MFKQKQGYTRVEDDAKSTISSTSNSSLINGSSSSSITLPVTSSPSNSSKGAIHLRNVAYSRPLAGTPTPTTRAQVLDRLMPLSKNPWSNVPTIIDDGPYEKP
ncbi:hypothetical protein BX616_006276 [Lobosporangium transversale]|nr:hypothetical protein BX616_006276 [Lobosporangium transversale]